MRNIIPTAEKKNARTKMKALATVSQILYTYFYALQL